jgi:hypothetical protein
LTGSSALFQVRNLVIRALALICALLSGVGTLLAQDLPEPADTARFRIGGLRFTPSIAVTSLGVDQNVFNELDDPKQDTTAAVGPAVDAWLTAGATRLSVRSAGQYLYFREYENQRSWNTENRARIEVPLAHVTPFVAATYINSRERPGYEIDSRARRRDTGGTAGIEFRLSGKTQVNVSGGQTRLQYDRTETFLGQSLSDALDRTTNTETVQWQYALTPLTTFVLTTEGIQDRFQVAETRNSDSIRVTAGFDLKPFALISGKVALGFRHFDVHHAQTPDYDGFVAAIDARYAFGATQIAARVDRDVTYSFESTHPYYTLTDTRVAITERVTTTWDLVARTGRQSLGYRSDAPGADRTDRGTSYGGGIGYRFGDSVRLGFDVDYYRRRSQAANQRNYEGLRYGASVSYGLPQ